MLTKIKPWITLALVAGLLAGLAWSGLSLYRLGWHNCEGQAALERQRDIIATWKAGQEDLAAQRALTERAQRTRDALSRQLAEIDHAPAPPPRPECSLTAGEYGLLDARRNAILAAHRDAAGPLQRTLPRDTTDRPGPDGNHQGPAGLGLRLPAEADRMRGLDQAQGQPQ